MNQAGTKGHGCEGGNGHVNADITRLQDLRQRMCEVAASLVVVHSKDWMCVEVLQKRHDLEGALNSTALVHVVRFAHPTARRQSRQARRAFVEQFLRGAVHQTCRMNAAASQSGKYRREEVELRRHFHAVEAQRHG
jgi:hypothetical protein